MKLEAVGRSEIMALEKKVHWDELVKKLAADSSPANLAGLIEVKPREVSRWIEGIAVPQERYRQKLIQMCDRKQIDLSLFSGLRSVYDTRRDFAWNATHGPQGLSTPEECPVPLIPTPLWEYKLNSPLGIPASILTINTKWISPFLRLGFDAITYKTCRTRAWEALPHPNIVYLPEVQEPWTVGKIPEHAIGVGDIPIEDPSKICMGNSFNMPGMDLDSWKKDVKDTISLLGKGQILIVSVVGTSGEREAEFVEDFVRAAVEAAGTGAAAIELNFSCPNAYGKTEGSVYHEPALAGQIARKVRSALPKAKILLKIGYLKPQELSKLFDATHQYVDGFTAINTIPLRVISQGQYSEPFFPGGKRARPGISGAAIREHALTVVSGLRTLANTKRPDLVIFGVGGISTADHVRRFLEAGANCVQMCTSVNHNPFLAIEIRRELAGTKMPTQRSLLLGKSQVSVPFRDQFTAGIFDLTIQVCSEMKYPFDQAYPLVQKKYIEPYISQMESLAMEAGTTVKTRLQLPGTAEIRSLIADHELKKTKK
jgi:dihydroorotate dehydrogenase (NAD+) catalytic subunit